MKKSFSCVLMIIFLCSLQVETGAINKLNTTVAVDKSNKLNSLADFIKFMEVKERTQPIVSFNRLSFYDEDSIIEDSDLIVRGTIENKKEVAFEEYTDNIAGRIVYRDLVTLKINKILKQDESNTKIEEGSSINIFNETSSHNWYVDSLKIEANKEYILFLRKAKDDGAINYSTYGSYVINAPDWSIVLKENNKYYYDENFKAYEYIAQGRKKREDNSGYNTFISSRFEDRLLDSIVSFTKSTRDLPTTDTNFKPDLKALNAKNIEAIVLNVFYGEKKIIKDNENKESIVTLLQNVICLNSDTTGVPANIPGYMIEIVYKDGYDIKTTEFRILNDTMNYSAWDKNYNYIAQGYFKVEQEILPQLRGIYSSYDKS